MNNSTSYIVNNLTGLTDEAFIQRAFVSQLRRSCDPIEASLFLNAIRSGSSRNTVWNEILTSEKKSGGGTDRINDDLIKSMMAFDGEDFIRASYRRLLGRDVDESGLKHYLYCLNNGEAKVTILYRLLDSDEGRARMHDGPSLSILADKLQQVVGIKCKLTVLSVLGIFNLDGDFFLQSAYKVILGRNADSEGLSVYKLALENGVPKARILHSLAESDEGRFRRKTISVRICLKIINIVYS